MRRNSISSPPTYGHVIMYVCFIVNVLLYINKNYCVCLYLVTFWSCCIKCSLNGFISGTNCLMFQIWYQLRFFLVLSVFSHVFFLLLLALFFCALLELSVPLMASLNGNNPFIFILLIILVLCWFLTLSGDNGTF